MLRRHDEEGATATVFLLSLLALLSLALLAIDGGFLLSSQRGQIADTDSAALAAAHALADAPCTSQANVNSIADTWIAANDVQTSRNGDVQITNTSTSSCPESGILLLSTQKPSATFFGPLFGFDDLSSGVVTQVAWGQGTFFEGVRPIGICGADPHYQEWEAFFNGTISEADYIAAQAADPTEHPTTDGSGNLYSASPYPGISNVHRITFERLSGTGICPGAPGNFGWLDFDAGGNSNGCNDPTTNNELNCRLRQGYEGGVSLGGPAPTDEDCNTENSNITNCPGQTGAQGSSVTPALNYLKCGPSTPAESCEHPSLIVVYSALVGNGNNARFDLDSLAGIVLRDFDVGTGQLGGQNWIDVEFVDLVFQGELAGTGGAPPGGTAPTVVNMCGTSTFSNC